VAGLARRTRRDHAPALAVLALPRHATGLRALLVGRAAGGHDAEHAHRLQAQ